MRLSDQPQKPDAEIVSPAAEIEDPLTGELIDVSDVDALISCFENLKATAEQITYARGLIAQALAAKTESVTKTRRIAGKTRIAKIEMPSVKWDNAKLKEAYHAYPKFRDQYLRIAEVAPDMVQLNKLRNMTGEPDLETFKKIVLAAERPATGNPSITIEK